MANSPITGPNLKEELPLYPPLMQLLRVTATVVAGPAGVTQMASSSFLGPRLYVAFTQQLRTDGLLPRDREPCLVDDVNGRGISPGFYTGRLAGSHTSLPVYEVTGSALSSLGLTVEEVDGSPKVLNVHTIRFDQADGYRVSEDSPGVARLDFVDQGGGGDADLDIYEDAVLKTTLTTRIEFNGTDFDVTAADTWHAVIKTEGGTEAFYVLTNCVAGVLKKRLLTFTRGLFKSVGAEIDL